MVQNKKLYLSVLELLKEGKRPSQISKELDLKKQTLQYYLTKLKKFGAIKKVSYGVWEVQQFKLNTLVQNTKKIRGHAFIWKIKLPEKITNWEQRLNKLKIKYKLIRGTTPRIFLNNKKIWLGKESLTIYEPNSFYGNNAIESRKYAVVALIEDLELLEKRLQFKLGNYVFQPSREHFALVKNDLAKQVNREGNQIRVSDVDGEWLWIDASDGIGELETGNRNALVNNVGVQKWWNDMKKTNFEWTPSVIGKQIAQVTTNQMMFNKNFESHVEAIQTLSATVKELREEVRRLRDGKS